MDLHVGWDKNDLTYSGCIRSRNTIPHLFKLEKNNFTYFALKQKECIELIPFNILWWLSGWFNPKEKVSSGIHSWWNTRRILDQFIYFVRLTFCQKREIGWILMFHEPVSVMISHLGFKISQNYEHCKHKLSLYLDKKFKNGVFILKIWWMKRWMSLFRFKRSCWSNI